LYLLLIIAENIKDNFLSMCLQDDTIKKN
jgi:hypothetical protein